MIKICMYVFFITISFCCFASLGCASELTPKQVQEEISELKVYLDDFPANFPDVMSVEDIPLAIKKMSARVKKVLAVLHKENIDNPNNPLIEWCLGEIYRMSYNFDYYDSNKLSEKYLLAAIQHDSSYIKAYVSLILLNMQTGKRYDDLLEKAIKISKGNNPEIAYILSIVHYLGGNMPEAFLMMEAAYLLEPSNPKYWKYIVLHTNLIEKWRLENNEFIFKDALPFLEEKDQHKSKTLWTASKRVGLLYPYVNIGEFGTSVYWRELNRTLGEKKADLCIFKEAIGFWFPKEKVVSIIGIDAELGLEESVELYGEPRWFEYVGTKLMLNNSVNSKQGLMLKYLEEKRGDMRLFNVGKNK